MFHVYIFSLDKLRNIDPEVSWKFFRIDLFLQYNNQQIFPSVHNSVVCDHKRFHSRLVFQEVSKSENVQC